MSSLPTRVHLARSISHRALFIPLLLTCFWRPGISATIDSQDFGPHAIGELSSQSVAVPVVTPGPATFSLQYSLDFSLGPCTPSANGCLLSVTFDPIKPGLRQDAVVVKDASGRVVEEILLHGVGLGPLPVFSPAVATFKGPLIAPSSGAFDVEGIAAEPDGKILILTNNKLYRFDNTTGDLTAVPGLSPPASGFLPSFYGLATDAGGNIYYGYLGNGRAEIHRFDVATGTDSLIASDAGASSLIVDPSGAIFYVQGDRVFRIPPNTNTPVAIAGDGIRGYGGDNGPALQAHLNGPLGIALDLAGNLYIADGVNHRVRKVDTAGLISTVAGTGVRGDRGDGGLALQAGLDWPSMLVADAAGDLYISTFTGRIRRIDRGTGLISTVAGADPQTTGSSSKKIRFSDPAFPRPRRMSQ